MTASTELDGFVESHKQAESVGAAATLGHLLWWSVNETSIHHSDLIVKMDDHGLPKHPKPPADSDVFRRVTNGITSKKQPQGDGTHLNVLCRDVSTNPDEVLRRVVVETVDPEGKRLSYTEAWDIRFDKETGDVNVDMLPTWSASQVDDEVSNIPSVYQATRGCMDSNALRAVLKKTLDDADAIPVRKTGGVVFLPKPHDKIVDSLEGFASDVDGVSVHSVPIPDVPKQEDMITEALTASMITEVDEILSELKQLQTSGDYTDRKIGKYTSAHKRLKKKLSTYSDLLSDSLDGLESRLLLMDAAVGQLVRDSA